MAGKSPMKNQLKQFRKILARKRRPAQGAVLQFSRRIFLQVSAVLALSAYVLDPKSLFAQGGEKVTVYRLSVRRARVCRACRLHARYKVFISRASADANRAHSGCNCAITEQRITETTFQKQFTRQAEIDLGVVDLRHLQTPVVLETGALQGRVTLAGSRTIKGVTVSLTGRDKLSTITDSAGLFTFKTLVPGIYRLRARAAGHLPMEGTLSISPGQELSVLDGLLYAGDVDKSGRVDGRDADLVVAAMGAAPGARPEADVNADGIVDLLDLAWVGRSFGRDEPIPWPGLTP